MCVSGRDQLLLVDRVRSMALPNVGGPHPVWEERRTLPPSIWLLGPPSFQAMRTGLILEPILSAPLILRPSNYSFGSPLPFPWSPACRRQIVGLVKLRFLWRAGLGCGFMGGCAEQRLHDSWAALSCFAQQVSGASLPGVSLSVCCNY